MRFTPTQIDIIRKAISENFGQDVLIWLFGSRVDDPRRGGDVDLYIETKNANTLMSRLRCKIALKDNLDLSVDLLLEEPNQDKPIFYLAKAKGIPL